MRSSSLSWPLSLPLGKPVVRTASTRYPLGIGIALIMLWTVWAAAFNTAQFGDNVEQFNWAQSLQLGYHKHPPLPSWLLGALVHGFGPSVYWAYLLAALCLVGTLTFTWLLGRDLFGERIASAGTLLWGLNMTVAQRAQLYNHNTVLVLFVAATAWCAWRAVQARRLEFLWWTAAGVLGAAATLAKYQALVPLAGLVFALVASGALARRAPRIGLLLAGVVLFAACLPHAMWVARHGFTTLRYATEAVAESALPQRLRFVLSFVANQVRIWSPALLAIGVCAMWDRFRPRDIDEADTLIAVSPNAGVWMTGLLAFGLVTLTVMALVVGVSLRNHWGVQGLQFLGLWLAWRWQRKRPIDLHRLTVVTLAVHALNLGWYAIEHRAWNVAAYESRFDTLYPARRMAYAAVQHWTSQTDCPLRYIAGTAFDAGLVSLYSGGRLQVFDSESATPWVHPDEFRERGALYVLDAGDSVPDGVVSVISFNLAPPDLAVQDGKIIRIGVRLPLRTCVPDAASKL